MPARKRSPAASPRRSIERDAQARILAKRLAPGPPLPSRDDFWLKAFVRHYRGTGDPFDAWSAYYFAGQLKDAPVPRVIAAYVGRVARRMTVLGVEPPPSRARLERAVLDALELSGRGRGAIFAKWMQRAQSEVYAAAVLELVRKGRDLPTAIHSVAKAKKVTRKTVRGAYNRVRVARRFFGTLTGAAPLPRTE